MFVPKVLNLPQSLHFQWMLAAYHVVVYVMIEGQNYLYQQLSTSEDSYCQNYFFSVAIWTQTSLSYHHIHVNTNIG